MVSTVTYSLVVTDREIRVGKIWPLGQAYATRFMTRWVQNSLYFVFNYMTPWFHDTKPKLVLKPTILLCLPQRCGITGVELLDLGVFIFPRINIDKNIKINNDDNKPKNKQPWPCGFQCLLLVTRFSVCQSVPDCYLDINSALSLMFLLIFSFLNNSPSK